MKTIIVLTVCLIGATAFVVEDAQYAEKEGWKWIPNEKGELELISDEKVEIMRRFSPRSGPIVTFRLYTQANRERAQLIVMNDPSSIEKSNFDVNNPIRLIAHGWQNNYTSPVNAILTDKYLNKGGYNIIIVDWSPIASSLNYPSVRDQVEPTAAVVAEFIEFLHSKTKFSFENLYLIGHSLGAHVVGLAAKALKSGKVNTIVGLDPALPLFLYNKPETRLSSTDAEYVEIIHSNAGILGFQQPIGHVSFYPNWGRKQPGCGFDIFNICCHSRSIEFFAESIEREDAFPGIKCSSYNEIQSRNCIPPSSDEVEKLGGEPMVKKEPGLYYLQTAAESPFGLGTPPDF